MNTLNVAISEAVASADRSSALVTHALGSCIGVAVWDPLACTAGLLHILLPDSEIDPGKALHQPCMFADTGVPELLRLCRAAGGFPGRLRAFLIGGARFIDREGVFDIGAKNHAATRTALHKAGIPIYAEDVGGTVSRTVRIEVATGRVFVKRPGGAETELAARRRAHRR